MQKEVTAMDLFGEFSHTIDAKNRLFIPAGFRAQLGESFYVSRKMEKCLNIYSEGEWTKFKDRLNALPDSVSYPIKKFIFPKTIKVSPDAQGRIVLNTDLLAHAEITKDVMITGMGDYAQIWAKENWTQNDQEEMQKIQDLLVQFGL
ncbi:MAG: division/cell wall cluster transcriptional repressor MraZ [Clostridia bacterium]|nr:division/cell wall cluster transcriptional repressor MraZ [Clostridia bacterium]